MTKPLNPFSFRFLSRNDSQQNEVPLFEEHPFKKIPSSLITRMLDRKRERSRAGKSENKCEFVPAQFGGSSRESLYFGAGFERKWGGGAEDTVNDGWTSDAFLRGILPFALWWITGRHIVFDCLVLRSRLPTEWLDRMKEYPRETRGKNGRTWSRLKCLAHSQLTQIYIGPIQLPMFGFFLRLPTNNVEFQTYLFSRDNSEKQQLNYGTGNISEWGWMMLEDGTGSRDKRCTGPRANRLNLLMQPTCNSGTFELSGKLDANVILGDTEWGRKKRCFREERCVVDRENESLKGENEPVGHEISQPIHFLYLLFLTNLHS